MSHTHILLPRVDVSVSEDETASASLVRQEQHPDVSLMERVTRLEQVVEKMVGKFLPHVLVDRVDGVQVVPQELVPNAFGEKIGPVPVPQIKEEVSERAQHAHFGREPFDNEGHHYFPKDSHQPLTSAGQPGDQAARDPADAAHRQGSLHDYCDTTTGSTVAQPGDQVCRASADAVHRQGYCRRAYRDTATGPSTVAQPGDQACRDFADTVRQQGCSRACHDTATGPGDQARRDSAGTVHRRVRCRACCDTATGPSVSNCVEDSGSPACAVHRQSGHACDQAEGIIPQKRIPERVGQLDDVPVPQILNEIVEVVKAFKNVPQERISGRKDRRRHRSRRSTR